MDDVTSTTTDSKSLWLEVHGAIPDRRVTLGRASSNAYLSDPKMLGFMAARYKFVAKMLAGTTTVLEIGCGDAFGAPIVAPTVGHLFCTDIDDVTLRENMTRLSFVPNVTFEYFDFRRQRFHAVVEAAYCIDVLEHIYPDEETIFLDHVVGSLEGFGVAIIGTPNAAAEAHASENSRRGHVNLKDHRSLATLASRYFHRVFVFSMNDEVVHTGFYPMAHYLWALCVGPRR